MAWVIAKWLGAAALLTGAAGIGFEFARKYRKRPLDLRELMAALRMLRNDISYGRLPLPDSLAEIAAHFPQHSGTRHVFAMTAHRLNAAGTEAGEAFVDALRQNSECWSLHEEDLNALRQFSHTMGATSAELQAAAITALLGELSDREREAVAERDRFEKVYRTAGVLIGMLLVVMLW